MLRMKIPEWVRVEKVSRLNGVINRLRFGVGGDSQPRSSIWTAWGDKREYYLGVENLTGSIKASFHRDGRCHVKFRENYWWALRNKGLFVPRNPKITAWRRPPTPDSGAVHVASVLFPRDFIKVDAEPNARQDGWWADPVFYFAHAPAGEAVEFLLFYTKTPEAIEQALAQIGKPLFYTTLDSSDESVSIVVRTRPFDAAVIPQPSRVPAHALYDRSPIDRSDHSAVLFNAPNEKTPLQLIQVSGVSVSANTS
jgi:hypothetical protein